MTLAFIPPFCANSVRRDVAGTLTAERSLPAHAEAGLQFLAMVSMSFVVPHFPAAGFRAEFCQLQVLHCTKSARHMCKARLASHSCLRSICTAFHSAGLPSAIFLVNAYRLPANDGSFSLINPLPTERFACGSKRVRLPSR